MTELINYVYKTLLDGQVSKHCGYYKNSRVQLEAINEVDKLPCEVYIGINSTHYFIHIESEKLLEKEGHHELRTKEYYKKDLNEYTATTAYRKECGYMECDKKVDNPKWREMKIVKIEDVKIAVYKVVDILKNLKFNTYVGEFLDYNRPADMYDIFKSPNVVIEEGEECCICYERTLTKTWCKHSLCFKCMERLPITHIDNDGDSEKSCPICRADVIYPPPPEF